MRLILHLCALAVWQYTLNASQPSMNQQTVSSPHYRSSARVHRLCRRTTKYLGTHKMTTRSTYTTPDLPQHLLPVLLYAKTSTPTNIVDAKARNQLPTYHFGSLLITTHTQKPTASCHTLHTIIPLFIYPQSPTQCTALQLPNPIQSLTHS